MQYGLVSSLMATVPTTRAGRFIAQSDLKAERLIATLRMVLAALLFAGVSFVLSQTQSAGLEMRQFELVSLLVGAVCYFTLGAVNFYFATEERLKPWMSWAFNLGEVVLVAVQLYVDVADPATPSLLIFASPVILVAALVICVQVLRFQIGLHIFSTVLLIGLCAVILFHDPQIGTALSPDAERELQLLYSVPPNVMRLIMLSAMAFLIGTAVYRSKRLIETVAKETEIAENRKRFLPNEISNAMSDENLKALRLGEERDIAALFVDIRGFTGISERIGARQTAELLSQYRTIVTDTAVDNDGVVDKFIGDGALVIFGLHGDFEQACVDAVGMGDDLLGAVSNWNAQREGEGHEGVRLAIGIHAGPAVIGAIGDDRRLEFTAIGDTINTAARLEELAKDQNWALVISRQTARVAAVDASRFIAHGPIAIKGRLEPVEVLARL
ncbi:MAG: adenylate/guanylate cyclase domain-containing protein [Pseudomonadota bacterium]